MIARHGSTGLVHGSEPQHPSNASSSKDVATAVAVARPQSLERLADPNASGIHFLPTTFFSAILHNAICLGFDLAQLADCSAEYCSPFYRPDATPRSDPTALVASANVSSSVPPGLRPTLAQFIIPHHASLDLIPIPLLRDRILMLSAAMPTVYDLWSLKADIYEYGGLSVWGSARKARTEGRSPFGSYREGDDGNWQPWDRNVWEAEPWFLDKWSMVVDGPQGELWKQSRWWQKVREARASGGEGREGEGEHAE